MSAQKQNEVDNLSARLVGVNAATPHRIISPVKVFPSLFVKDMNLNFPIDFIPL